MSKPKFTHLKELTAEDFLNASEFTKEFTKIRIKHPLKPEVYITALQMELHNAQEGYKIKKDIEERFHGRR